MASGAQRGSGGPLTSGAASRWLVIAAVGATVFALTAAMGSTVTAALLLTLPYLLLLTSTAGVRRRMWVGLLAALVLGTSIGLWSASTDSTGAVIFVWLLPLQIILGILPFPSKAEAGPVDSRIGGQGAG